MEKDYGYVGIVGIMKMNTHSHTFPTVDESLDCCRPQVGPHAL